MAQITLAELVRNGTMSAEMAAVLWAAVDEQVSFLTVAMPRFAGKTTTSNAILAMRPPEMPVHWVDGHPDIMERLKEERRGGYLAVPEFDHAPMPGYIWGPPVRRVFDALSAGYSLQTSLHATSVEHAIHLVTYGNGVSDELASTFKLVLYIERFGATYAGLWRRLVELYEVHKVDGGRPIGQSLFQWRRDGDRFEKLGEPQQFARDRDELRRRAEVIDDLALSGRTSPADVGAAVHEYRALRGLRAGA
ncbi:MAG TPA: hypothetical protein VII57_08835 [Dehalococcoidia bacterium]